MLGQAAAVSADKHLACAANDKVCGSGDHGRMDAFTLPTSTAQPEPVPSPSISPGALRQLDDLPGPRPWPLVGNTLQVRLSRFHQDVENWVTVYGPLMQVHLAGRHVMVVSDHALIQSLLKRRPDEFRRPTRMAEVMAEMGLPRGVFTAEGEQWARQRRMVMASFAPQQVRAYFPALLAVTHRLRARWQQAAHTSVPIDLQADLMRFTVDAVAGLAFGEEVDTLSSNEDVIQRHLDQIFPAIWRRSQALVPYWRHLRLPRDRALDRSMVAVRVAIEGFMAAARERLHDPARRAAPPNLLEAMLVAADEPGSGMNDQDVVGNVFTMLLAGEDTTATSLSWLIYLLSRHPEALKRVREEVDSTLPADLAWTHEQLSKLDFMEACIHESMRLKPVGPLNVVEALHDTVVADVRVPAGTPVLLVMRHDSLQDAQLPQAQAFLPERWMTGSPESRAGVAVKRVSSPFGAGPRICPGRYLALLEIKLAAAMLLQHFDIVAVDTPDGRDAQEQMALTMTPVGLRMHLKPRRPSGVTA
jgi:cytochrome P450